MSGHLRLKTIYNTQLADEKLKKDEVIKLSHWKHDSTLSDRKPTSPGDFNQSTEGSDAWAHCLRPTVLSQKKIYQEDKKGLVCEPLGQKGPV